MCATTAEMDALVPGKKWDVGLASLDGKESIHYMATAML